MDPQPKGKLPVDLDAMHAALSRGIRHERKEHKRGKKRFNIARGEYIQDVSPDNADRHLAVDPSDDSSSS
jgi:hypothetical protein